VRKVGKRLRVSYGISDSAVGLASVALADLMNLTL